tara:strand:+ start:280 stop:465 length:186 start_codon:yes stop_codon:yes gene_type:complete
MFKTMTKGEKLILLVSGEVSISPNFLMEDSNFIKQAKKLIKQKLDFYTVKDKLVNWCKNNY